MPSEATLQFSLSTSIRKITNMHMLPLIWACFLKQQYQYQQWQLQQQLNYPAPLFVEPLIYSYHGHCRSVIPYTNYLVFTSMGKYNRRIIYDLFVLELESMTQSGSRFYYQLVAFYYCLLQLLLFLWLFCWCWLAAIFCSCFFLQLLLSFTCTCFHKLVGFSIGSYLVVRYWWCIISLSLAQC